MVVAAHGGQTSLQALSVEDLAALDASIKEYRSGGDHDLRIIGWGSISIAIEWQGSTVIKPLPLFPTRTAFDDYSAVLEKQFKILEAGNVAVLSTTLQGIERENRAWSGYLIQPRVPAEQLLPQYLRSVGQTEAVACLVNLALHLKAVVSPRFGLDGDITNWSVDATGGLLLLDSSTPLVRDDQGRGLLDLNLFLASIPGAVRVPVRRFVVPRLVDKFFEVRRLFIDVLSGFYSEQLSHLLPQIIPRWNSMVEKEITEEDVLRYKRRNERVWRGLGALERAK
ncbi:MAG: hypothetical protein QOH41_1181 [Blastocatellia bacterium]|jgi:hypothetical protein|nr:hypothetical protein [Blastocatellia bacterium]